MRGDWVDAVLLVCTMQNLLLAIGLWRSSRSGVSARRMALMLVVVAGMTTVYVLGWTGRAKPPTAVAFFPLNLPLALGPLLYGYVHALALGRPPVRERLHFLPALAQFAYLMTLLCVPEPARGLWRENVHDPLIKPLIEGLVLLSLGAYAIAGLRLLRRYRSWLAMTRSDADRHVGGWIGLILTAVLTTLSLLAAVRAYTWFVGELETWLLQLWFAAWSAWLGVEGWRHSEHAYPPMDTGPTSAAELSGGPSSASHDALSDAPVNVASDPASDPLPEISAGHDWTALGERWRRVTETAGWWRAPDLSLSQLAGRLGTNSSYLSRAINEGLGMNFNGFINRMRAEEVARRIAVGRDTSDLLLLALDAGFSSKATFNRAFRARFGMTPSEYRRRKS